jgi:lysozyme
MKVSEKGLAFIASHEGLVLNAYLDPVGIPTIGYGFTNRSRVFSQWAKAKWGRKMRMGDKLTKREADDILGILLEQEYEPPVEKMFGRSITQEQFDACVSACYNLGAGCLGWRWAKALKSGDAARSAELLRVTGVTAKGKRLRGLVRRRGEEADLIEFGRYPSHGSVNVKADNDIGDLQRDLEKLGYEPGPIDGKMGPQTRDAIRDFQNDNSPLAVDGIAGPATRSAIERALKSKPVEKPTVTETVAEYKKTLGVFSGLVAAVTALLEQIDGSTVALIVGALVVGFLANEVYSRYKGGRF